MDENEFPSSPRDADGHGTHIASVAAGNPVRASLGGAEIATVSGIAPRARLASYKACWLEPGATRASCAMSDLQAAIEDAIADGVDIINYSVGTATGGPADEDALALLAAADAGVLAVVAAGNGGPGSGTIESPGSAPWVLTVAASSRAGQRFDNALRITAPAAALGDFSAREAAFTPALRGIGAVTGRLVLADDGVPAVESEDGSPADACQDLVDASALTGNIALIRRGLCPFQEKVERAEAAGAIAAVVFDNTAGTLITMTGERGSVAIPAVLIGRTDGEFLAARLVAGDAVEARLDKALIATRTDQGNVLYAQSARGPNEALPDILKPDVTAPGVDILAAQTPDVANGVRGELFQYLSGTSMAVPQVAGIAALLREAHPDWSPAAIRSALVTTARQNVLKEDGQTPADAFDFGGGHVAANSAVDPGLLYEADVNDYAAFACGAGIAAVTEERCAQLEAEGYSTSPDDLNLPSITVSSVVGERSVRRRVTNAGPADVYQAAVVPPPGTAVAVSPQSLTLGAGETADFTVKFTNLGDAGRLDAWNEGSLTWVSGERQVRSPLVVAPAPFAAPAAVSASGASGTASLDVAFGYDGSYAATAIGLGAPARFQGNVIDDPLSLYTIYEDDAAIPDYIRRFRITVAAGTRYLRVATAPLDEGARDDIDLYLLCPDGQCPDDSEVLASDAADTADEVIDILEPAPGEYVIDVHGYETDETVGGPGANFELGVWQLAEGAGEGSFAVQSAPAAAETGATGTVSLGWQGLQANEIYMGLVTHSSDSQVLGYTLVEVVTP
jgi:subtilisin family serine protease